MKKRQILFILFILCCILSGCSKNNTKDTDTASKGRYVEKTIALPEDVNTKSTYLLAKKDNKPFLFSFSIKPFSITGYQLDSNGAWVEATPAWLKSLTQLPEGWYYHPQFIETSDGCQYFYYTEFVNENLKGCLLRSKDGTTYETLKPEKWDEIDPNYGPEGGYKAPSRVTVLENGTLAALFYTGEVVIYDLENLKEINTISNNNFSENVLSSTDNKLVLAENADRNGIKGIDVYNTNDYKEVNYPFEATIASYSYCDTKDQDILLCNADGIFKLENGSSVWNCIVDGTLTSLAMPTMNASGFVSDSADNYYVLYQSDASFSLKQYSFDPNVNTVPSKELKIYSLRDNNTLRQAIAIFQQKHSDVKVSLTVAMTEEEYASCDVARKADYIRALNTKLLAEDGYDILVLDGLPASSFIEKGVLADISDIIQPMIDDGTLPKNIMDNYLENGKRYRIPARISLNLLYGIKSDTKQLTTLKALADYASAHPDTPLFGSLTVDDLVHTFTPYLINSILDKDGKINRDNLIETLNTLKQLFDNSKATDDGSENNAENSAKGADNIWNLTTGNYLCLSPLNGFLDGMFPFGLMTHVKRTYLPFENSFTPNCELGINSKGKQLELSKEFLLTVLSAEVQKNDLYDGFAVNTKALLECSKQDVSGYSGTTDVQNADGTTSMLEFYPLDEKQCNEVIDIYSTVNNKITANDSIAAAIMARAKDFFNGNQSASDAADAIIEEMNIYLSE